MRGYAKVMTREGLFYVSLEYKDFGLKEPKSAHPLICLNGKYHPRNGFHNVVKEKICDIAVPKSQSTGTEPVIQPGV